MALVHSLRSSRLTRGTAIRWMAMAAGAAVLACTKTTAPDPPLAGDRLKFQTSPSSVLAGSPIGTFKVQVVDSTGATTTTIKATDVTILLDSTDPRDTLFGTTVVPTVNGEATFTNLSLKRAANGFRLIATAKGITGAVSLPFNVSPNVPAKLAFVVQPSTVIAGEKMVPAPQVVVQDAVGNTIPNDTGIVFLSVATGPSSPIIRNNAVSAVSGVARFDSLRINTASNTFSLQAVGANGRGLAAAVSTIFVVQPGAARRLLFTSGPSTSVVNTAFNPALAVTVTDSMSNVVTAFSQPVTLQLDVNPTGATLGGTTTVSAAGGVATFSGISVDLTCTSPGCSGYRLRAVSATVPDTARSSFFAIVP